jgi:predicted porin
MKKLVLAAAIGGIFAVPAYAQSSVTLYGIVDTGVTYVNNAGKAGAVVAMQSGVAQGSRWGLKGAEDLGGGLKAVFQLEDGFNVNNGALGQGGLDFGRQAYVGLASDKYGTLTLGRQYDSIVDFVQPTTMNGTWGALFSHADDIDNSDNGFRVNNAIKYTSLSYAGFQFGGLYSLGGVAGSTTANSTLSAGASYTNGPVYLAAAYFTAKNPATQFLDGNFTANQATPSANGPFGYVGHPANMQVIGAGGTYAIGPALLGLDYTNTRYGSANGTASSVTFSNYELWGQYAVTPATTLSAGYTFTAGKVNYLATGNRPKYNQFNLLADYALSKRTDVYLMGVYQKSSGGAFADIYDGFPAGQASTTNQVLARVGIRAKF